MPMMLDQNLSSKLDSIFSSLFAKGFEAINFTVAMFDHFHTVFLPFLTNPHEPGDARNTGRLHGARLRIAS